MGVTRTSRGCSSWPRRATPRKFAEQLIILENVVLACVPLQLTSSICLHTKWNVIALLDVDRRLRV
eukprot:2711780-Pleurochrysis_carterae.AAC.1